MARSGKHTQGYLTRPLQNLLEINGILFQVLIERPPLRKLCRDHDTIIVCSRCDHATPPGGIIRNSCPFGGVAIYCTCDDAVVRGNGDCSKELNDVPVAEGAQNLSLSCTTVKIMVNVLYLENIPHSPKD